MKPRLVLDTNVVVSALLFTSGRLDWIRRAWQHERIQPLACRQTVDELLRVLAYPKFKLTDEEQGDLLEDFLPYAEIIELPEPWPVLPLCRDAKDQVFLVLAHVGHAHVLVTGDDDLLAMHEVFSGRILTPEAWREQQGEASGLNLTPSCADPQRCR